MSKEDGAGKTMREVVQKKFLEEVIGDAGAKCTGWMILVLDKAATRVISSALTMFDIMEKRITLVEQLDKKRQPFREMDVVYLISPTTESVQKILEDFESAKAARYGGVHIYFLDTVTPAIMGMIQQNPVLASKVKSFKEIFMDFIANESSVFQMDQPRGLLKMYGTIPDPDFPGVIGRKLATLCISMNEHPVIRFQCTSAYAREMAQSLNAALTSFKSKNPKWWCHGGDDQHMDRERAHILLLDRTFDPLTPLMHEYTYSAMVNDLLCVSDNVINYQTTNNKGAKEEKEALLGESDPLWTELRYFHIAKVIQVVKDRMQDVIQTNAGALQKGGGALSITAMAAAVKELPEYRQTMSKLSQHVAIAQQCMDAFGKYGLMAQSQVEQTMSTGVDEDGKEVKGARLLELAKGALSEPSLDYEQKIRLLAIFIVSQRGATPDEKRQLVQACKLTGDDQQIVLNLERLCLPMQTAQSASGKPAGSIFTSLFKGRAPTHAATAEGEYADTRHVGQLKGLLEQLINGDLPTDKYASTGPSALKDGESKSVAKSVRRNVGAAAKFGRKDQGAYNGSRYMVFVAGGVAYSELRVAHDVMGSTNKEVIIGGTHLISPQQFIDDVAELNNQRPSADGDSNNV